MESFSVLVLWALTSDLLFPCVFKFFVPCGGLSVDLKNLHFSSRTSGEVFSYNHLQNPLNTFWQRKPCIVLDEGLIYRENFEQRKDKMEEEERAEEEEKRKKRRKSRRRKAEGGKRRRRRRPSRSVNIAPFSKGEEQEVLRRIVRQ